VSVKNVGMSYKPVGSEKTAEIRYLVYAERKNEKDRKKDDVGSDSEIES